MSLVFASKEIQNDKEVDLQAVAQNGNSLQYSSKELQNDKEVVLEAVTNKGNSFQQASKELQNDNEFFKVIQINPIEAERIKKDEEAKIDDFWEDVDVEEDQGRSGQKRSNKFC